MLYLFLLIGLIVGTLAERYILPVFDLLMSSFSNNKQLETINIKKSLSAVENEMMLETQKKQREINRVENDIALETLDTQYEAALIEKDILDIRAECKGRATNIIGYHMDEKHPEEDDEDWDDDFDLDKGCYDAAGKWVSAATNTYTGKIGF